MNFTTLPNEGVYFHGTQDIYSGVIFHFAHGWHQLVITIQGSMDYS
tara:strand:- start:703 stop:840 length:138 start_codon:yes stop_codon:yes gene_type:complete